MHTATETQPSTRPTGAPVAKGSPIVGALLRMRADPLELMLESSRLGPVVRIPFPLKVAHLIREPEHIKHVLVDAHKIYGKKTRGYDSLRLSLGQGLVTSEGEFWKRQRRIAQPAFHHQRIQSFADTMSRATLDLSEEWARAANAGTPVDVAKDMMRLTLRIAGLTLFSKDLADESEVIGPALTTMLERTIDRITYPLALPLSVPTPSNLELKRALVQLDEIVLSLIAERRKSNDRPRDLLTMLLEAEDEESGERMSDKELRDEVLTLVLAGHETTANALSWTFYLLSQSPEAATALHRELDEVLGGPLESLDLAKLSELRFTEATLKESMRIYPPVWSIGRSCDVPDEIAGARLPKGSLVFLSPYVTHRNPRLWPEPERFDPLRFLSPEIESLPKYAYFPFGGGPRICIGNSFAMMEARIILAALASRFSLSLHPEQRVVPEPLITLRPKYGLRMFVTQRR